jgi:hypothetical protein
MFLTQADLVQLTGRKRKSDQRRWLIKRGYPFELTADGRPVVLRAAVEARFGVRVRAHNTPNWEALDGSKAA